ncbi:MAG: IS66 family insertion sequence element accessory protein TnpB [Limnochordia bacterium]
MSVCLRQRNGAKILEWSERGFWLHYFRLEKGRLPWPQAGDEVSPLDVSWQDLRQLLEGTPLKPISQRAVKLPRYVILDAFTTA